MAVVRGCNFPETVLYDVARHVWYEDLKDGSLRAGITPVGVALAREILIFTPKRVGHAFAQGRALATVESAKWVGSVKAGFAGTIIGVNEAVLRRATLVNTDCYGDGWMFRLSPEGSDWAADLTPGADIAQVYEDWMENMAFAGCGE